MKRFLMVALFLGACSSNKPIAANEPAAEPATTEATTAAQHDSHTKPLADFALEMMEFDKCAGSKSSQLSQARKKLLARQIGRILEETGGNRASQETFILLMCIESRYRPDARSPVGAMGIAQVMPETGKGVAKEIGLGEISKDDLLDPEINIKLGYSYFLKLVDQFGGNFAKAAAGYNSGPASSSVKSMTYLGQGASETGWYVGNLYNLKEELRLAANP